MAADDGHWSSSIMLWVLAVLGGALFGVGLRLLGVLFGWLPPGAVDLVRVALIGAAIGLFAGVLLTRQHRRRAAAVPAGAEDALRRWVEDGQVPTEPAARDAVQQLLVYEMSQLTRSRNETIVLNGLFGSAAVVFAVLVNPWMWLLAVVLIGGLVMDLVFQRGERRRGERRLAELREHGAPLPR